jgi:hypothetical protein
VTNKLIALCSVPSNLLLVLLMTTHFSVLYQIVSFPNIDNNQT